MNLTSIGDLAQSMMLRSRSAQLKQTMGVLTQELSSGRTADVTGRLGGDFSYLSDIERNLARLKGYGVAVDEATLFATAAQTNLDRMLETTVSLSGALLSVVPSNLQPVRNSLGNQALMELESTISSLNTNIAGRSIFAGTTTDRAPLNDVDVMMSALLNRVSGMTTATAIARAVERWFEPGNGFDTRMYEGSTESLAPVQVGPGQEVTMPLRADDQDFRDLMRSLALGALATDQTLALDDDVQNDLLRMSGEGLMGVQARLAGLQSDLGFAQARIDEAGVRNASAELGLEQARGALLSADPYETATRLEDVQFQLESLYTVTVRNSRLSLLAFLR